MAWNEGGGLQRRGPPIIFSHGKLPPNFFSYTQITDSAVSSHNWLLFPFFILLSSHCKQSLASTRVLLLFGRALEFCSPLASSSQQVQSEGSRTVPSELHPRFPSPSLSGLYLRLLLWFNFIFVARSSRRSKATTTGKAHHYVKAVSPYLVISSSPISRRWIINPQMLKYRSESHKVLRVLHSPAPTTICDVVW